MLRRRASAFLVFLLALPIGALGADRKWQTGTLISAERHDDPGAVEQHQQTKGSCENHGDANSDSGAYGSSADATAGRSDLHSNWMYYTVSSGTRVYIVRVMVNLPSGNKPKADVGDKVEYAVDGTKFYFHNSDGSEAKADVVKTTAQMPQSPPPPPAPVHPDAPQ